MSDQHPSTPAKPKLTPLQREQQMLDLEIKIDNAKVALKTYKRQRLEIQTTLANLDVNEANKKQEIAQAEAALKALEDEA